MEALDPSDTRRVHEKFRDKETEGGAARACRCIIDLARGLARFLMADMVEEDLDSL